MKRLLILIALAGVALAADPPKKLPDLDQKDIESVQAILSDPELAQLKAEVQAAQDVAKALGKAMASKQEALQTRLNVLLQYTFPEKHKLAGYTYDLQKGWVLKDPPPAPAPAPASPPAPAPKKN